MCRVCHKRPEIPEERYGRCEACARAQRMAIVFRTGIGREGTLVIKSGELSPHALGQRWRGPLEAFKGTPSVKPHLGLHEVEMIVAKDRLESIRIAADLAEQATTTLEALRAAAQRSETSWAR